MVNAPLGPDFALRVNGVYNESDGWVQDAATGRDLRPEESWALRAALRWNLAAQTAATLTWDRDEIDQLARPAFGVVPLGPGDAAAPFPSDPTTFLDPRKAPVYNDVIGNEESRELNALTLAIVHELGWASCVPRPLAQFDTLESRWTRMARIGIATYFRHGEHRRTTRAGPGIQLSGRRDARLGGGVSYYQEDASQVRDTLAFTTASTP